MNFLIKILPQPGPGVSLHTKHTQTHANTRKHTANTRKHTQTHANARKHTQTQTANTRKHSPIAKTAIPVQQIIERRPKKKIIHKFHS